MTVPKIKTDQIDIAGKQQNVPKKIKHAIELKISDDGKYGLISGPASSDHPFAIPVDLPRFKNVDTIEELIEQVRGKYVIDKDGIWEDIREETRKGFSYIGDDHEKEENYKKWTVLPDDESKSKRLKYSTPERSWMYKNYNLGTEDIDRDYGLMVLDFLLGVKPGCMYLFLTYLTRAIKKHYPENSQDYLLPFIQFARFTRAAKDSKFPRKLDAESFLFGELERRNNGRLLLFSEANSFTEEAFQFILDLDQS
jgi:hypothetical protein